MLILEGRGWKSLESDSYGYSVLLSILALLLCLYWSTIYYGMIFQPLSLFFFALALLHYLPKSKVVYQLVFTV